MSTLYVLLIKKIFSRIKIYVNVVLFIYTQSSKLHTGAHTFRCIKLKFPVNIMPNRQFQNTVGTSFFLHLQYSNLFSQPKFTMGTIYCSNSYRSQLSNCEDNQILHIFLQWQSYCTLPHLKIREFGETTCRQKTNFTG